MPLNEIVIIGASKSVEKHLRKALPDDTRVHAVAKQQRALEHIDNGDVSLLVVAKSTRNALAFAKKIRLNPEHGAVTVLLLHQDKHTAQIRRHRKSEHAADGYLAHSKVAKGAKKAISDALTRAAERSSAVDDSRVPTELMDVITDLQAVEEVTENDIEVLGEFELDADDLEEVGPCGGSTGGT